MKPGVVKQISDESRCRENEIAKDGGQHVYLLQTNPFKSIHPQDASYPFFAYVLVCFIFEIIRLSQMP